MSDLISRQAAIDAVSEACGEWRGIFARCEEGLKALPSAQPDITEDDVKEFCKKRCWVVLTSDLYDEMIQRWSSAQPQRWIPVTERLPREYTRVIGYMAWKAMTAIEYQHGRWYSIDHLEPLPDEAVVAWMPLPEAYKEDE